ncbi:MAG: tRNA dihydrouridine synthase DusB [Elusimicrobia bacterium]|nr:tRNA dihydrouridine synthase DusB [Elusimicrobiota bacterium]
MHGKNGQLIIGNLKLRNNLVMAPMAGITDLPFRILAKKGGAGLVCTEMISARALVYGDQKTMKLLTISPEEHPVSVQIFGSEPDIMEKAALIVENEGADILDINFGCPVKKIIKSGAGSKLLENEKLMSDIMTKVVNCVRIPVTIKIRIGQNLNENVAPQVAKLSENCGVSMVSVHGRYASQGHSGKPVLEAVEKTVASVKIPVAGNGGINDEFSAKKFIEKTKCKALMIGRAAIGDFRIFQRIEHFLNTGETLTQPTWEERINLLKNHAKMSIDYYGEKKGLLILRKVAAYYLRGMPNASRIRNKFNRILKRSELDSLLEEIWQSPYFEEAEHIALAQRES